MDEKQLQMQQRVAKKLSALRQTLTGDERQFLDELITGRIAEVDSHKMDKSATPAPDEVEAHQFSPAADPSNVPQINQGRTTPIKFDPDKEEYQVEK
jgi:hypothetical protein